MQILQCYRFLILILLQTLLVNKLQAISKWKSSALRGIFIKRQLVRRFILNIKIIFQNHSKLKYTKAHQHLAVTNMNIMRMMKQ